MWSDDAERKIRHNMELADDYMDKWRTLLDQNSGHKRTWILAALAWGLVAQIPKKVPWFMWVSAALMLVVGALLIYDGIFMRRVIRSHEEIRKQLVNFLKSQNEAQAELFADQINQAFDAQLRLVTRHAKRKGIWQRRQRKNQ